MRNNKLNYFVVGMFVIIMVVGFIISIAVLSGRTGEVDSYYAWYDNVTGIKYGSQVVYEGYPIGQVEKISPEVRAGKMSFKIDFTVLKNWKIPEDSIAEIASPGLLAAVVLNIQAGQSQNAYTPGNGVTSKEQSNVFGAMTSLAEELTIVIEEDVKPLISNVDAAVKVINEFVGDDAATLLQDFGKRIPAIATNIEEFSISINKTSQEARLAIEEIRLLVRPENRKMIEGIIQNLDISSKELNKSIIAMEVVLKDVDALVVGPKPDVDAIVDEVRFITETVSRHIDSINRNLDASSRNMNEFSRQIRSNPGILLNGTPPLDPVENQ